MFRGLKTIEGDFIGRGGAIRTPDPCAQGIGTHGHVGDRQSDANPQKLIARNMIKMTKEINAILTGSGAYPHGKNVVTCWTCHRGP